MSDTGEMGETPPAPTSEVLDAYDALCRRQRAETAPPSSKKKFATTHL